MIHQLILYARTALRLRPGQILARVQRKLGLPTAIGVRARPSAGPLRPFPSPAALDFDPALLSRFSPEEMMRGRVTFLHESAAFSWDGDWDLPDHSPLWHVQLHSFSYLSSFVRAYLDGGDGAYLAAIENSVGGWIDQNPAAKGGPGWSPHTVSVRAAHWLSCLFALPRQLDGGFRQRMIGSLREQYRYLARHLEKDLLCNHYLENLKALILCALAFEDGPMLQKALTLFKGQCREQLLPDGMHVERSLTYHKAVLEALIRVAAALRGRGRADGEIEGHIAAMLSAACALERDLDRTPLFHDGGGNLAPGLDALIRAAREHFGIRPRELRQPLVGGFCVLRKGPWTLIADAASPGPAWNPGHSHCSALSFELFHRGHPLAVNCGTYGYQCRERAFFRCTAAHNAPMIDGEEQSQCWGVFRMGRGSRVRVISVGEDAVALEMTDQRGRALTRRLTLDDEGLQVRDEAAGHGVTAFVHLLDGGSLRVTAGQTDGYPDPYAPAYGEKSVLHTWEIAGRDAVRYRISAGDMPLPPVYRPSGNAYRGVQPLVFLGDRLYFARGGALWTERSGRLRPVVSFRDASWLDRWRPVRRLLRREVKCALPLDDDRALICADGKMYLVDAARKDAREIARPRPGFSLPLSLCEGQGNHLAVWGDYGPNADKAAVCLYGLRKDLTVETLYRFAPGQIRHVHGLIPRRTGGYYVFTGDRERDAGIYAADGTFSSVTPVGTGDERWRAAVGFDTPRGLLYATDAVSQRNAVYLLREDGEAQRICDLNGSCLYGTKIGDDCYFSTAVEPDERRRGPLSWLSRKRGPGIATDEVTVVRVDASLRATELLRWKKDLWPMKLMQYGSVRFPAGAGEELWLYPVAVKRRDGWALRYDGSGKAHEHFDSDQ